MGFRKVPLNMLVYKFFRMREQSYMTDGAVENSRDRQPLCRLLHCGLKYCKTNTDKSMIFHFRPRHSTFRSLVC